MNEEVKQKSGSKKVLVIMCVAIILILCGIVGYVYRDKFFSKPKTEFESNTIEKEEKFTSKYEMSGNSLQDFDLAFLQFESGEKNVVYSPLSIKYTLAMLSAGASGTSKSQIDAVIGKYQSNKYHNSANMSFANAIFIKNTYKDLIKQNYINSLQNNYSAEVIYDSFDNPNAINSWVSNKTLNLIDKLVDDVTNNNFVLVNALAIDMEWTNVIQAAVGSKVKAKEFPFVVKYKHEDFRTEITPIDMDDYSSVKFGVNSQNAKAVEVGAVLNNYDIVNDLGKENVSNIVESKYREWLGADRKGPCYLDEQNDEDIHEYVKRFIKELDSNYKNVTVSNDFSIYDNDSIKVFAKDLKKYSGVTLEYVGIMPKQDNLDDFIKNNDASSINSILKSIKKLKVENFASGKITHITGFIPLFNFDYELDLEKDLKQIGITDIFDSSKSDLSNLISLDGEYIETKHKANIEFSNEGIKAAAATSSGGMGDSDCSFEYLFEVPVELIDITFDKPYMFIIRNKSTGEVWFAGKVYEPTKNQ